MRGIFYINEVSDYGLYVLGKLSLVGNTKRNSILGQLDASVLSVSYSQPLRGFKRIYPGGQTRTLNARMHNVEEKEKLIEDMDNKIHSVYTAYINIQLKQMEPARRC
ncbi:hypothetical protein MKW98_022387 [Papaver atlanticum]|uniref:Uncharacterized protein n=2 Tax=Papaver atlanticum TaxID=357466 RepID=A0AAD4SMZ5_9MAGN|nr:hypothetical protein MKW98_022387 [Papaver atlanticum]